MKLARLYVRCMQCSCPSLHTSDHFQSNEALLCPLQAALVVYDEIHYLRDKERGVVWEESIVLMPKSVRFAFLSATIPNAMEFAEWIARTHRCLTSLPPHSGFPFAPAQAFRACDLSCPASRVPSHSSRESKSRL